MEDKRLSKAMTEYHYWRDETRHNKKGAIGKNLRKRYNRIIRRMGKENVRNYLNDQED